MRIIKITLCILLVLLGTSCMKPEQEYDFPLEKDDIERALANQELNWSIDDVVYSENSDQVIISLKTDNGISYGISTNVLENNKVLNINWFLPSDFTVEQFDEYYNKDILQLFNLANDLYDNNKNMKSVFKEFINYYSESNENHENNIYWTKRLKDEHFQIEAKDMKSGLNINKNRIGLLYIFNSEFYEYRLQMQDENWKKVVQGESIKVNEVSIDELKSYHPVINDELIFSEHFIIKGHLENIKEIKVVPDSLKNIASNYLKPNRDKYLAATLADNTGSVDVFLQTTSLNKEELSHERNHNIVLFYYENMPVIVVRFSPLVE